MEVGYKVSIVCVKCVVCIHWGVNRSCLGLLKSLHYVMILEGLPGDLDNILSLCLIPGMFWALEILRKMKLLQIGHALF